MNNLKNVSLLIKSGACKIVLKSEKEVAYDSNDYFVPWGTIRDNSRNNRFNDKLYRLFPDQQIYVLDLGCSGGGFVKDCIDDGHFAVGLEGGDYSKKAKRAEWATIPEFLFTCDITSDFDIFLEKDKNIDLFKFDVVTSWDVLEHIEKEKLQKVADNVLKHIKKEGLWILSIAPYEDIIEGVNLHRTMEKKEWWVEKFGKFGLVHIDKYVDYFNTQFVRGHKFGAPNSFHLVLSPTGIGPNIPTESIITRIKDRWLGTKIQRELRSWIVDK